MIIKVRVSTEYEIDVSDFDPAWVDIDGYAIDCAKMCMAEDLDSNCFSTEDFTYKIIEQE